MLSFIKESLQKTAKNIKEILPKPTKKITKEELEEILIAIDMDYDLVELVLENLSNEVTKNELEVALLRLFRGESYYDRLELPKIHSKPCVTLIVGVNGAGKTTSIAKLTNKLQQEGKTVLLGAADTFRAAAIEQLKLWGNKLGVSVIAHQQNSDPSAVAFDTINSGIAKGVSDIIIDTAGRLHNKENLQKELQKIVRTCNKALNGAPHQCFLVIDGTQGSSALAQAKIFANTLKEAFELENKGQASLSGVIVTKLDGTSKGGAIFSIVHELRTPIALLGVGEREGDWVVFNEQEYINSLLDYIFEA